MQNSTGTHSTVIVPRHAVFPAETSWSRNVQVTSYRVLVESRSWIPTVGTIEDIGSVESARTYERNSVRAKNVLPFPNNP